MPARSVNCASSGANGCFRLIRKVRSSTTSTESIGAISERRCEPGIFMCRSIENLAAAASSFSPSWNRTPGRRCMVSAFSSGDSSQEVASCGTGFRSGPISTSLSQSAANTIRLAKVRASVGSRASGSSIMP